MPENPKTILLVEDEAIIVYTEVITPRKMAELAYRKSEEKYRTIIQGIKEGFWAVDSVGHFVDVNAAYSIMSGYSREEFLKMGIRDVEALEDETATKNRIARIKETGYENFETLHRRKDGSVFQVAVSTYFLHNEFICFCRYISAT